MTISYKIERQFVAGKDGKMKSRYMVLSKPIDISGGEWTIVQVYDTYSEAEAKIKTFIEGE